MGLDGERMYYDTFDLAIAGWPKWKGQPWKVDEARAALDAMIAIKGPPAAHYMNMHGAFYVPAQSRQYIGITWQGHMALQLQAGFMRATEQLTPRWKPDLEAAAKDKWFKYVFPDHIEFGKASEPSSTRMGKCSCSPWLQQPVESECSECGRQISAVTT